MDPLINEKGLPLVSSEQVISDITYDDDGTDIGSTINTGWLDCVGGGVELHIQGGYRCAAAEIRA